MQQETKLTTRSLGFCASSEQFSPQQLIAQSIQAQDAGFQAILVSDHFQPWVPEQGQASFIWSVLGALGQETTLPLCTGVSTPGYRLHPAIIAQAAATCAVLLPGRFALGLGAGEALNEHVVGGYWPEPQERAQRLLESITIIQRLLTGELVRFTGRYYTVEQCRLYTLPETPPPVFIATSGPYLSQKAGALGLGFLTVNADVDKLKHLLQQYRQGLDKAPCQRPDCSRQWAQLHVSWALEEETAMENALSQWPNGGMSFPKGDLRHPEDFAALASILTKDNYSKRVVITNRTEPIIQAINALYDLGFTRVYLHNCGRNQEEWLKLCQQELIPALGLRA